MGLIHLIYASRPFGFDENMLNGILADARRNNPLHDITGALICRADIYLQLLEGPEAAIDIAYAHIRADDRHMDLVELRRAPITERLFPNWAMRDDPARSWMWTQEQVSEGAAARATPEEALAIFTRLAASPSD